MPRYENNRSKNPPYKKNLNRSFGLDDYESEGNFTSSRLPHENDNGNFRRDAWERIDNMEDQNDLRRGYNDGHRGYYGDVNQQQYTGENRERREERGGHYGKGPRGWKRPDERIREDVNEVLFKSYDVDASDIEVSVAEGVVTLTGTVNTRKEKREAEFCSEAVSGVTDVRNEITIRR